MENLGKKPTKENLVGSITIDVYEDSFEVKASQTIDMFTIFLVAAGIQEYLEELSETLDKPASTMLQ